MWTLRDEQPLVSARSIQYRKIHPSQKSIYLEPFAIILMRFSSRSSSSLADRSSASSAASVLLIVYEDSRGD